jgi:hypothetical protein
MEQKKKHDNAQCSFCAVFSYAPTAGTAKPKASEKKVPLKEGRTTISVKFPPEVL